MLRESSFSSLRKETLLVFALLSGQLLSKFFLFCFLVCLFVFSSFPLKLCLFLSSVRKKKKERTKGKVLSVDKPGLEKKKSGIRACPLGKLSSHILLTWGQFLTRLS